jgi:uncharacterized protein
MDFLNDPILPESLPRAEEVRLTPLAPDYRKVLRLQWAIVMLFCLLIITVLIVFIPPLQKLTWVVAAGAGWLLMAAGWFALMEKSFVNKGYAIRDKDVIYRSGWLIQVTHTCPFNRIQHSTVTMGPLERNFGLARLVLYTAGSNDADMSIPGITDEVAQSLKEWITKKIADEPTVQL